MPTDTAAAIAVLGGPEQARLAIRDHRGCYEVHTSVSATERNAICDLALAALSAPAPAQDGKAREVGVMYLQACRDNPDAEVEASR